MTGISVVVSVAGRAPSAWGRTAAASRCPSPPDRYAKETPCLGSLRFWTHLGPEIVVLEVHGTFQATLLVTWRIINSVFREKVRQGHGVHNEYKGTYKHCPLELNFFTNAYPCGHRFSRSSYGTGSHVCV